MIIFNGANIAPYMKKPAQPNLSLIRGVACLQAVMASTEPLGSREVARRVDLEHTKVSRMLGTFRHLGLLEKTPDRRFMAGPAIHVLAAQSLRASGLLKIALPVLKTLRDEKLIVALGVLWRKQVCYLYWASPEMEFEEGINGCDLYPAEKSSIGRLLSFKGKKDYEFFSEREGHATLAVGVGSPAFAGIAFAGKIQESRIPDLVEKLQKASQEIMASFKNGGKK